MARDGGVPYKESLSSTVYTINVLRNRFKPVIHNLDASITVSKRTSINTAVYRVNATDNDNPIDTVSVKILYSIVSSTDNPCKQVTPLVGS